MISLAKSCANRQLRRPYDTLLLCTSVTSRILEAMSSWRQSKNILPVLIVFEDHRTGKGHMSNTRIPWHGWQIGQSNSRLIRAHLLAGGLRQWFGSGYRFRFLQDWLYCNYNWINITRSGLALSHAALTFHECQRVSPLTSLGHCAAKRLHPTASPRFPCRPPVLPPGCFAWGQTPELTPFNILALINIRIAKFEKWCFNVWKPFSHSSHWLTGIQEESPPQMSKTQLQNLLFQQNVLRWSWQTHAKSPLLNFKETLKRGTRYITSIEIWKSHTH